MQPESQAHPGGPRKETSRARACAMCLYLRREQAAPEESRFQNSLVGRGGTSVAAVWDF